LALEINSVAETMKPPALVIAIRFPEDDADLGVELHKTNLGTNPAWRRERVAFLLAKRSAAY
jgi:hypothetical protein